MTNLNSISLGIQNRFSLPSNSFKNSCIPSSSPNISFNFKSPLISIRKTPNIPTNVSFTDSVYAQFEEETLYDLLGISESGTLSDIKRGYKKMASKYHPDVSPPGRIEEYTMRFIRVQEAYETLSDPESRVVYDFNLHLAFSAKKGLRFEAETTRWKPLWEVQVEELKRRSAAAGGRMTWAARIRKERTVSDLDQ